FAKSLESCRNAALMLYDALQKEERFAPLFKPELDIVVWAVRARAASESSARAREIFDAAAKNDLHLALATFPREMVESSTAVTEWDSETVTCLRACVMKPEHLEWLPEILKRLRTASLR
ncbi:aspartate aminotransferase family protein, partial [bacterium]|nr:aspartate aminotransferase family protein [bacterium]